MRFAICNELFEGRPLAATAHFLAGLGYEGLELAPFTLGNAPTDVSAQERREICETIRGAGLAVVGLHWLLARTEGFHLTSPEPSVRQRTAERLAELTHLCADLGGDLMVLGSPQQRSLAPGIAPDEGRRLAADTLARVLPTLTERDVDLCLEPLGPSETNFLNTCAEALELAAELDHPRIQLHLDVKALVSEPTDLVTLLQRHAGQARHFHANDPNRRGPGFGPQDFRPILATLRTAGYSGWVSIEVFDFTPDPETIARQSLAYLRECAATG
ncbi:MAG TPA: sugar phosphate isomerase/epimerase [Gemmatales bacterium]|nr:sugar phosphate isomerase/epimerase [Gemmatales bacterium]